MAKSIRSKVKKRLRTVKRGVVKEQLLDPTSKIGKRTTQIAAKLAEAAEASLSRPSPCLPLSLPPLTLATLALSPLALSTLALVTFALSTLALVTFALSTLALVTFALSTVCAWLDAGVHAVQD